MKTLTDNQIQLLKPLIFNTINELESKPHLDCSLLGGDFGSVMSLYYASNYGLCSQSQADYLLDKVINGLNHAKFVPTYCNGISGFCIGLCQLEKDGFLEGAYDASLKYQWYLSRALNIYKNSNLDFLHGAIGIAMYFLICNNTERSIVEIEGMIQFLYSNSIRHKKGGVYWKFPNRDQGLSENLSLSHGISAVVVFLARAFHYIHSESIREMVISLLKDIGIYLKSNLISPKLYGCYTPMLPSGWKSRLGWCYGDVGTSIALRFISQITNDHECAQIAYDIAKYAAIDRRDLHVNYIYDACICHGSAGLIVFFNNCFDYYGDSIFQEASVYWTKVTNTMAKPYRGVKRFDHYYSPDNTRYNSINVLEGDSGVILTLLNEDKVLNNILLLNNEF